MYICFSKGKEEFNCKGESLGIGEDRALYYSSKIGRKRIYRQSYPLKPYMLNGENINKGLRLFTYKRKENAQKLCDDINERAKDNFEVIEIKEKNNV